VYEIPELRNWSPFLIIGLDENELKSAQIWVLVRSAVAWLGLFSLCGVVSFRGMDCC
jgi:hypothetical protein